MRMFFCPASLLRYCQILKSLKLKNKLSSVSNMRYISFDTRICQQGADVPTDQMQYHDSSAVLTEHCSELSGTSHSFCKNIK